MKMSSVVNQQEDIEMPMQYLQYLRNQFNRLYRVYLRDNLTVVGYAPHIEQHRYFKCQNDGLTEIWSARVGLLLGGENGEEICFENSEGIYETRSKHSEENDEEQSVNYSEEEENNVEHTPFPVYWCTACNQWHRLVKQFIE